MILFVHEDSMKPAMRNWNIVYVENLEDITECEAIGVGDIILYTSKGFNRDGTPLGHTEKVLHRIVKVTKDRFEVKGDNRDYSEFIKQEDVYGILRKVIL